MPQNNAISSQYVQKTLNSMLLECERIHDSTLDSDHNETLNDDFYATLESVISSIHEFQSYLEEREYRESLDVYINQDAEE